MDFQPIVKTSAQINADAESFLSTYHPALSIPVPIEEIIELNLKIDVIPIPGLKDIAEAAGLNIDAFIGSDFKSISIDKYISEHVETRYRFSLSHEIGHMVLHGYLYNHMKFNTTDEWVSLINEMSEYERDVVEYQANEFAGLILAPKQVLVAELEKVIAENEIRFKDSLTGRKQLSRASVLDLAMYPLSLKFKVSENVIRIRSVEIGDSDRFPAKIFTFYS